MQKRYFIFRNATIEHLFSQYNATFSGYNDISHIVSDVDGYFWAYLAVTKTNKHFFAQEIASYSQQLQFMLSQIPAQKPVYAFNMYNMHFIYSENVNRSVENTIIEYNNLLVELSEIHPNLKIIDFAGFCKQYAFPDLIDWRFYYMSQMQINPKLAADFTIWLTRELAAIDGKRKKCIVLDLDNTLWGGILGEDGSSNIQIGNAYPGNAFLDFQQNLLELSKSGIILTVCSKNNENDVFDVWNQNPFLQIKREQLSAWRINWNNKADNIKELAQELNIGLDSMVFVDDNPAERELVKQLLPMVEAPDFPKQPYLLPLFFEDIAKKYFQIYKLTDEEKDKLNQYKANARRSSFQKSFTSFNDYLKSLEIVLDIQELNAMNLSRIAQMTQKTNQFNLTTKRYTDEDIRAFQRQGAKIYCVNVSDRFGNNGITGLAIILIDNETKVATIDSFMLSCRILGKNIEVVFLKAILQRIKQLGCKQIISVYIPTLKNEQVKNFYEKNSFTLEKIDSENVKTYSCMIDQIDLSISNLYKFK
jgi:FkbH-like protein